METFTSGSERAWGCDSPGLLTHCHLTAPVPRVNCPEHGVKRIQVPWAREGSRFTLLFKQAALALVREMPVKAAARQMAQGGATNVGIVGRQISKQER